MRKTLDLPDGTQCQVTEVFPEGIGDSHGWQVSYSVDGGEPQPGLSAGVEIDASEETSAVEVAYTNTAVEAASNSSAFTVTKQLEDPDSAVPGDFEFEFSWRCETGGGLLIPEDEPGTFTLQADEVWSSEQIPQGSSCVLQESEPSEIEGVTWQTNTSVDGSDPAEGSTAYLTLPQSEGPVEVLVTNTAELTEPPPDPTPTPTETPTEPTDPPTEPTPTPTEPDPTPTPTEPTPTPTPTEPTDPPTEPVGYLAISKTVQDEEGVLVEDTEFSFTWEFTLSDGSTVPEDGPGTVLLTGGEVWVSEEIEAEAQCAVEETEPEPIDGYDWFTWHSVDEAEYELGHSAELEVPEEDLTAVAYTNILAPSPEPTPSPTESTPTEPTPTEPTPTEPTDPPTDTPTPTEPTETPTETPTEPTPTPTEPTPTEPSPTEPTEPPDPTDPAPTDPTPTDPEPTDPVDTESPPPGPQPEPSQPGALPETGTSAGWPAATAAVALLLIGVSLLIFNQRRDRSRTN